MSNQLKKPQVFWFKALRPDVSIKLPENSSVLPGVIIASNVSKEDFERILQAYKKHKDEG